MNPDELELHQLLERCTAAWEAGGLPSRHDLARLFHLVPRVFSELIRLRQQLSAARAEAGTLPLLLPPTKTR